MSKIYKGIDISLYQGNPDFAKVKAAGIDFVIHKAGQGRTAEYNRPFSDPQFEKNVRAASQHEPGFYQGSYWYFMARTEAEVREEASYYIELLKKYRYNLQLWAVVDVEDATLPKDKATLTKYVKLFCDLLKEAGFRPMVYTSSWWIGNRFDIPSCAELWEANWSIREIPARARMWQCGTSRVNGINGNVDTNFALDIIGDINGDGKVDVNDVSDMLKYLAEWNIPVNESQGDINQNGYIDAEDVTAALKKLAEE